MDAAERIFTQRGLCATLDEIAADAGLGVATAYRHFRNKRELLSAFVDQRIDQAVGIATEAAAVEDPWKGLTQFLTRTLDLLLSDRGITDLFMSTLGQEWRGRLRDRMNPILEDLLCRARVAGVIRADLDVDDLRVLLRMLGAVRETPTVGAADHLPRMMSVVLTGLRPTGDAIG